MTVMRKGPLAACMAGAALLLTACGNKAEDGPNLLGIAKQAAGEVTAQIGIGGAGSADSGAADTPDAMAARALAANPGPLILADFEGLSRQQVLAETGRNRDMRTYMTPAKEAVILQGGMLTGTRGLGHDLSVAEGDGLAALIRGRRAGSGQRVMRYIEGDGVERPLPLRCTIAPGPTEHLPFAGRNWQVQAMVEQCQGHGLRIDNGYFVTADGQIPVSRQWIGPDLGHVTIQVIRP